MAKKAIKPVTPKKTPNKLFEKKAKPVLKQKKLRLSDFVSEKAIAKSVRNSVTQTHIDKLNELFEKKLGDMMTNSNQHVLKATEQDAINADNETVPGYSVPTPPTMAQLYNQLNLKLNGESEEDVDIDWSEQAVASSRAKISVTFSSSVILAACDNEKYFDMFIASTLLTMMNLMKDRCIGFGPGDVPYFGTHYLSFTHAQPKAFMLEEGNKARVTLSTDVAKYQED